MIGSRPFLSPCSERLRVDGKTVLLLVILIVSRAAEALKCIECPYTPIAPHAVDCKDECEGDVCFIVVNAYFNGTLSAGCINLRPGDSASTSAPRQHCHREPERNRTVCACTSTDHCNGPKTPIVDYYFIAEPILEGYSLVPPSRQPLSSTKEPVFELSSDLTDELFLPISSHLSSVSTGHKKGSDQFSPSGTTPSNEPLSPSPTYIAIPVSPMIASLTPSPTSRPTLTSLTASPKVVQASLASLNPEKVQGLTVFTPSYPTTALETTTRSRPPPGPFRLSEDSEEPTIEVKSSVFIKPKENLQLRTKETSPSPPVTPTPTEADFSGPLLLSGSGRPRVLPTDAGQVVAPDGEIVVVKTVNLEVKEELTTIGAVPIATVVPVASEASMGPKKSAGHIAPPVIGASVEIVAPPGHPASRAGAAPAEPAAPGHIGLMRGDKDIKDRGVPLPLELTDPQPQMVARPPKMNWSPEVPAEAPVANMGSRKVAIGEGSIEEAEVSAGVQIGDPSRSRAPPAPKQPGATSVSRHPNERATPVQSSSSSIRKNSALSLYTLLFVLSMLTYQLDVFTFL